VVFSYYRELIGKLSSFRFWDSIVTEKDTCSGKALAPLISEKSEILNPKSQTISKFKFIKSKTPAVLVIGIWCLGFSICLGVHKARELTSGVL
jgi:hypothetical protein